MTSRIIVNNIQSDVGVSSVTISSPVNLSGGITGGGFAVGTGASIGSPATNVLTVSTNNTERIRVGAAGSIGIGIDNPTKLIDITGVHSGINTTGRFVMSPHSSGWDTGVTSGNIHHHYIDNFRIYSGQIGSGTERFKVDSSGRTTLPYQPVATAINTSGVVNTTNESTFSKVTFITAITNRGNHYSTSTGYFTCPVAGVYYVNAFFLTRAISGSTGHNVFIRKNDATTNVKGRNIVAAAGHEQCTGVTGYIDCAAGDTLSIYVSNGNSGDFFSEYSYVNFSLFG
jgi:hypothetical protein